MPKIGKLEAHTTSGAANEQPQSGESMSSQHAGSCLCGEVRYIVAGIFDHFYLCHCSYCRKDTGSAHAANLFSATATLTWQCDQSSITSYRLPGTRHARSFCKTCGSAVPRTSSNMIVVPAGSLDTDLAQTPNGNIFTGSRASWDNGLSSVPNFESFPA